MNKKPVINIKNIQKKYGAFKALDEVDLVVEKGMIYGILGPNGAGKSTLIRIICGVLTPDKGGGKVAGYDLIEEAEQIKKNIGYMSQKFSLYDDLTVMENLKFYSEIYIQAGALKNQSIKEVIDRMDLAERLNQLTKTLSGGWKQRLALGCALIHKPEILILDEPTAGVDPVSRRLFWNTIKDLVKEGMTVLVTTHYMDEAETFDRVAFIMNGKIMAEGQPGFLIEKEQLENLEDVFIRYIENETGQEIDKI